MVTENTTTLSDDTVHDKKRRGSAQRHTDKRGRYTIKAQKPTGEESHTDITNSEGRTRDDTA